MGFLFSVLWHLKPTSDVKTEWGFPDSSISDGRPARRLKPRRRLGGEGVLRMGSRTEPSAWLTLSHSQTHRRGSGRAAFIKIPCSGRDRKKSLGVTNVRTFRVKTLFKMKDNKGRAPLDRKWGVGLRHFRCQNPSTTN